MSLNECQPTKFSLQLKLALRLIFCVSENSHFGNSDIHCISSTQLKILDGRHLNTYWLNVSSASYVVHGVQSIFYCSISFFMHQFENNFVIAI